MDQSVPTSLRKATVEHGGDPASLEARFSRPKDGWLDLSTGINPNAYSLADMPAHWATRLPRRVDMDGLLLAARRAYGVKADAAIVAAPGTQALIQMVPTLFEPSDVTILGPTYGEHAPAWGAAGHRVSDVNSICAQAARPAPFAVLVHPNNPDGRTQTVEGMLAFADELYDRGGALVVDEAFVDVMPEKSVTPFAGRPGLIVLRSFGKFFGLAGMRLGFAIGADDVIGRLEDRLGPWAVSGPAIWAGTQALNDTAWIEAERARLAGAAQRLDTLLEGAGLAVKGGTTLFRLIESIDAQTVFERLAQAGILVRHFSDRPRWLRFGLPGTEAEWMRLEAALTAT